MYQMEREPILQNSHLSFEEVYIEKKIQSINFKKQEYMTGVSNRPSIRRKKKTKLLLEWPPTIELEMRKTPNYLQLTCVAWTSNGTASFQSSLVP